MPFEHSSAWLLARRALLTLSLVSSKVRVEAQRALFRSFSLTRERYYYSRPGEYTDPPPPVIDTPVAHFARAITESPRLAGYVKSAVLDDSCVSWRQVDGEKGLLDDLYGQISKRLRIEPPLNPLELRKSCKNNHQRYHAITALVLALLPNITSLVALCHTHRQPLALLSHLRELGAVQPFELLTHLDLRHGDYLSGFDLNAFSDLLILTPHLTHLRTWRLRGFQKPVSFFENTNSLLVDLWGEEHAKQKFADFYRDAALDAKTWLPKSIKVLDFENTAFERGMLAGILTVEHLPNLEVFRYSCGDPEVHRSSGRMLARPRDIAESLVPFKGQLREFVLDDQKYGAFLNDSGSQYMKEEDWFFPDQSVSFMEQFTALREFRHNGKTMEQLREDRLKILTGELRYDSEKRMMLRRKSDGSYEEQEGTLSDDDKAMREARRMESGQRMLSALGRMNFHI